MIERFNGDHNHLLFIQHVYNDIGNEDNPKINFKGLYVFRWDFEKIGDNLYETIIDMYKITNDAFDICFILNTLFPEDEYSSEYWLGIHIDDLLSIDEKNISILRYSDDEMKGISLESTDRIKSIRFEFNNAIFYIVNISAIQKFVEYNRIKEI